MEHKGESEKEEEGAALARRLARAAEAGDEAGVARALAAGARAREDWADGCDGATALIRAARAGRLGCVKLLWSASDPADSDERGLTALMAAAESGHAEALAWLAEASPPWALRAAGGGPARMPMDFAIKSGSLACVEALAAHSAKARYAPWEAGDLALRSVESADPAMARAVLGSLDLGSAQWPRDGMFPLMAATLAGDPAMVAAALESADPRQATRDGTTALMAWAKRERPGGSFEGEADRECGRALLEKCDPLAVDKGGSAAIALAAGAGCADAVAMLLGKSDGPLRARGQDGALGRALAAGDSGAERARIVRMLATPEAAATREGREERTPLMIAARLGFLEAVEILAPLSDLMAVDAHGQTARDIAQGKGFARIAGALQAREEALADKKALEGLPAPRRPGSKLRV